MICERSLGPDYTEYGSTESSPIFSPDLTRLAFYKTRYRFEVWHLVLAATEKSLNAQLIIDGVPSEEFHDVSKPVFTPDSAHVAYLAYEVKGAAWGELVLHEEAKAWLMLDGERASGDLNVAAFQFSPDGQRLVYVAGQTDKQYYLYEDGERLWEHEISGHEPQFNERGDRLAFVRRQAAGLSVVVAALSDGQLQVLSESAPYEKIDAIRFAPASNKVAFFAVDAGRTRVVVGDAVGPDYVGIVDQVLFTADGQHFAYIATVDENTQALLVDHRELTRARSISSLTMAANVPSVLYYARHGKRKTAERDGKPLYEPAPRGWHRFEWYSSTVTALSPNGERIAFVQPLNRWRRAVNVDGKLSRDLDGVTGLRFSDDGEHVLYQARDKKRAMLMLDGVEIDWEPKNYLTFDAEFMPGTGDVVARHVDRASKTWTVTLNGKPAPVSFDTVSNFQRFGPIRIDASSAVRAAGVRDGNYYMVLLAREGAAVEPDCQ